MPLPLFALMLCVFSVGTAEYVISGILPELAGDLGVSLASAGLLITAYALAVVIGGPVLTVLTTRVQRRPLMLGLMVLFIAGNLLAAVAPNYEVLMAARVLSALTHSTFFAVSIVVASVLAAPGQQASALAKVALGLNLATVLGVPLGTIIGQQFGWRSTFLAVAAVSAIATALVLLAVKVPPTDSTASARSELKVFANKDVRMAILMTALSQAGVFAVFTFIAPLLTEVTGYSATAVTVLLLVFGVGSAIGNLVGGKLADRALLPSLVWLLVALVGVLALFYFTAGNKVLAAITLFVFGAAAFSIIPGLQARILSAATDAPTLAIAVNISAFQIANALGAYLGSQVLDFGWSVRSTTLVGSAVTVAGLAMAVYTLLRERSPRPATTEAATV
jgi:DHA1 family inner membrane transport protein